MNLLNWYSKPGDEFFKDDKLNKYSYTGRLNLGFSQIPF